MHRVVPFLLCCLAIFPSTPIAAQQPQPAKPPAPAKNHWGKEAIGFEWTEKDSVDDRWNKTEIGPFLASLVGIPGGPVRKGFSIKVGDDNHPATVCYDTQHGKFRAAWTGGFLTFDAARHGIIKTPVPTGTIAFSTTEGPAWRMVGRDAAFLYRGHHRTDNGIVLEYDLGGTAIRERPVYQHAAGGSRFIREIDIERNDAAVETVLFDASSDALKQDDHHVLLQGKEGVTIVHHRGVGKLEIDRSQTPAIVKWIIPPGEAARKGTLTYGHGPADKPAAFLQAMKSVDDANPPFSALSLKPSPLLWKPGVTVGVRAKDDAPYVIDTFTVPFNNPYKALMFTSGHDFFSNGDIAVCTLHGDVWRVSGIDDDLDELTWTRFATGLFQPLGLKVIDDKVHVLGRDQITRLHDENNDGEADFYENFSNLHDTSAGGHDYVACLETDSRGDFFFVHATQGVVRISRDGKQFETIATGLRNPNGFGLGPNDVMTAAPQEGQWTPASGVFEIHRGDHFGFGGPRIAPERPLGYNPPLCWFPRLQDNSSGGQCWVVSDRWGPLTGQMLHFSFGQCRMSLVLREQNGDVVQGGSVQMPLNFDSGAMRGRFSPHDGQLYVTGLRGWSSSAANDGCLQRVRYTGKPVDYPIAMQTFRNGLQLTFSRPLDKAVAEDPDRYAVERWNVQYASRYGSPEYKVSKPQEEGRDEVEVRSVRLLDDRTLFLELADMQPVHQLSIRYTLKAADGAKIKQNYVATLHTLGKETKDLPPLAVVKRPGQLDEETLAALKPGLKLQTPADDKSSTRVVRLIAASNAGTSLPLNSANADFGFFGYIKVPLSGDYQFRIEKLSERVIVKVNGTEISTFREKAGEKAPGNVKIVDRFDQEFSGSLFKGYNSISITSFQPTLRLLWSSDDFAPEPISPEVLFHDNRDEALQRGTQLRHGRDLLETRFCFRCHTFDDGFTRVPTPLAEPPSLLRSHERLQPDWIAAWLMDPRGMRPDATMPHLFRVDNADDRRTVADITAYLSEGAAKPREIPVSMDDAAKGVVLWEDLACLACHRVTANETDDVHKRFSLANVTAKYSQQSLVEFLKQPSKYSPATRMPDFRLSDEEASQLAHFLRRDTEPRLPEFAELKEGNVERGRVAYVQRCSRCHEEGPKGKVERSFVLTTLDDSMMTKGCTADDVKAYPKSPDFGFSAHDRESLRAVVKANLQSTGIAVAEKTEMLLARLNCTACHSRDQFRSPRAEIFVDESERGFAPELYPNLTWTGEKLQRTWIEQVISGKLPYKTRPWLKGRMPSFPERYAAPIADGLLRQHGVVEADAQVKGDVAVGERLAGKVGGLDCRQCHAVGDQRPTGDKQTLIAEGINFLHIRDRLTYDYYRRFVLDPPRYDVSTRMPKLVVDGKTAVKDVYGGDAPRQFEAIWSYLQSLKPSDAAPK